MANSGKPAMLLETAGDAERLCACGLLEAETIHYGTGGAAGACGSAAGSGQNGAVHPSRCNRGLLYRDAETSALVCFVSHDKVAYKLGDCVYVDSQRPDQPYYVAAIQAFKMTKRDQLNVLVKWYYRPCELPDLVYDSLLQERISEEHYLPPDDAQSALREKRELFISDAVDTYPVSALRGKSYVHHYKETSLVREFDPQPDHFYYILGYNPETNRLASIQGEIRVGQSYQAKVPEVNAAAAATGGGGGGGRSAGPAGTSSLKETLLWVPDRISDADLIMYLQAARSMAAFAGMCDSGSTDDMCMAAARDQTTINALNALHCNNYDAGKALQELVKSPLPLSIEKRWSDEETKKFVRGLKQFGKNFFRIQKELLPHKQTTELVEFYYLWKKYPTAHHQRPRPRHRRVQSNVLRRSKTNGTSSRAASSRPTSSEFLDLSSASENESESDESAATSVVKDSSNGGGTVYACHHCYTTSSKNWHHAGKNRTLLCADCRVYFKKYGELRPVDRPSTPPAALFKPVKEEPNELAYQPGIRTRRSGKDSGSNGGNGGAGGKRRPNTPSVDAEKAVAGGRGSRNGVHYSAAADKSSSAAAAGPKSPSSASSSSAGSTTEAEKKAPRAKGKRRRVDKEPSSTSQSSGSPSGGHSGEVPTAANAAAAAGNNSKRHSKKAGPVADLANNANAMEVEAKVTTNNSAEEQQQPPVKLGKTIDTSIEESIACVVRESLISGKPAASASSMEQPEDGGGEGASGAAVASVDGEVMSSAENAAGPALQQQQQQAENSNVSTDSTCSVVLPSLLTTSTVSGGQNVRASVVDASSIVTNVTAATCSVIKQTTQVKEEGNDTVAAAAAAVKREDSESDEELVGDSSGILPAAKEPEPKIDDGTECHRSKNAVFRRHWYRGPSNSCSRTDLVFVTPPDSPLAKKRQREMLKRQVEVKEEKRERPSSIPAKVPFATSTMTTATTVCSGSGASTTCASVGLRSPTPMLSNFSPIGGMQSFSSSVQDLPALQRLKEYATAAANTYTPGTTAFYQAALHDPVLQHKILNGLYGPVEKERLEHELRERQATDLLKRDFEIASKPLFSLSGTPLGHSPTGGSLNLVGINPMAGAAGLADSRQMLGAFPGQYSPVGSGPAVNFPGASGNPAGSALPFGIDQATLERMHADRLLAERMQLERLATMYPANPLLRLEIDRLSAALSALATQHHTHSHTHSHTHLHIHPSSATTSTQESTTTSSSMAPSHQQLWPQTFPTAAAAEQLMQQYPGLFRPTMLPGTAGLACLENGMGINPAALMAAGMPSLAPSGLNLPAGAVLDPLAVERLQQIQQEHLQRQMLLERDRLMTAHQQVAMQHNEMMRRLQQEGSLLSTAAAAGPGAVGSLLRPVRSPFDKQ